MNPLVITHAGCADGFCAAWVMRGVFPAAEVVFANYGQAPPDVTGRDVFLTDFSYKRPVMLELVERAATVTVLDHHRTAEAELAGFADECERGYGLARPTVVFDMGKSGGRLAWEWVNREWLGDRPDPATPWLVDFTEDRDLWRHALPSSREVNAALRSFPMTFDQWDELARIERGSAAWTLFIAQGAAILRAEQQTVDTHVRFAREVCVAGERVLCVNATTLTSEIAGTLAQGRPFGVCYFDRADGKRVWSLRSRDGGRDVSEIAKTFGGGGHRNAAGFETPAGFMFPTPPTRVLPLEADGDAD